MRLSSGHGALVGRDRELARLTADLEAAAGGRGAAVAVIGEPGIGKTALVSAITVRAQERGARVLWGAAPTSGRAPSGSRSRRRSARPHRT